MPQISIITPAYNVERFLGATLDSIRTQTFSDWECILVDDGSSDGTLAIARRYEQLDARIRVVAQVNAGPSAARNRGFQKSDPGSRYITFMDSDDLWTPDALSTLLASAEQSPGCVGAHALGDFIDKEGKPVNAGAFAEFGMRRLGFDGTGMRQCPLAEPTSFATVAWMTPLYPPGLMIVRRDIYEKAGLFDPATEPGEDWDMLIRLTRHGNIRFIHKIILSYRRHDTNASRSLARNVKMTRYIHHKTFFSTENNAEQRELLRRGWRAWQIYKFREKIDQMAKRGSLSLEAVSRLPVYFLRFLRGYPKPRGI